MLARGTILPSRMSRAYLFDNGVPEMSVRFTQSCPTCGRRLQIRASLLGCTVACQHCQAEFVADSGGSREPESTDTDAMDSSDSLMLRVEQVLEKARQQPTAFL